MDEREAALQGTGHRAHVIRQLVDRIAALAPGHPTRVAIDGPDLAGKSTLADELAEAIRSTGRAAIRASVDDFHHRRAHRYRQGRASPLGYYKDAFDIEAIVRLLLLPLGPGGNRIYTPAVFDWRADLPLPSVSAVAPDDAILLADGVFLLRPELRDQWDYSVFVTASPRARLARSLVRDLRPGTAPDELERLFWDRYAPAHAHYADAVDPSARADAVVDNEAPAAPRIAFR